MEFTKFLFKSSIWENINITREDCSALARKIMFHVMQFRRVASDKKSCSTSRCDACYTPHLSQVISAIEESRPITFVLPAFPAKSPNPAKVLGTLPDRAEQLSLEFLNNLCQQIEKIYPPGARIILSSDGRVFNDVVGVRDIAVTAYQRHLSVIITKMGFNFINIFNLDDLFSGLNFNQMRFQLMEEYGEPLNLIKEAIRRGSKSPCTIEDEEVHRQYCGITRFLVEDSMYPGQPRSRNAIQKECRQRAYIVIQRSRAWSGLIAKHFPHAVRLSIHPQTCGTSKLGIRLMEAETWMTPWHGVAVNVEGNYILLKRTQAEEFGARLIYCDGQPSHYELFDKRILLKLHGVLHGA
jgi:pyoverdine/dityrosine biosynthesis protein Dit1